jgi:hypothetical protein
VCGVGDELLEVAALVKPGLGEELDQRARAHLLRYPWVSDFAAMTGESCLARVRIDEHVIVQAGLP